MKQILNSLLCSLGIHDFGVTRTKGPVKKCQRCGYYEIRDKAAFQECIDNMYYNGWRYYAE